MILSFNPVLLADEHRLCAGREPDAEDVEAVRRASAVLLPQGRHRALWETASSNCEHVFPNYAARYAHPGKIGDGRLFAELGLPHPATDAFADPDDVPPGYWRGLDYPVIVKGDAGGEGSQIFLVRSRAEAEPLMELFTGMNPEGMAGFVVQEYIPGAERSLRVAVMDREYAAYWRVSGPRSFIHNLASGGKADHDSDPCLMDAGIELVRELCSRTGIDLAGVDVIFRGDEPLLLEVNYFFGREGLGGGESYYGMLQAAVDAWLLRRGLAPATGEFDDSLASERD
jgi:ribosomal protein S6--L-glutamate ligase